MNNRCKGFTLIEIAIVVTIIGLLISASISLYKPGQAIKSRLLMNQELQKVSDKLVAFAKRNYRLPCPDTNDDGFENSGCTDEIGRVPFNTLDIELGGSITNARNGVTNMIYGVYTDSGTANDLTDTHISMDVFTGVISSAETSAGTTVGNDLYITNNDDCSSHSGDVAFVITSAGGEDRSGDTNVFDGVTNTALSTDSDGEYCFESPSRNEDGTYDDGVIAMSFTELAGRMLQ